MVKTNKKICIITGTRADYGLLRWVADGVQKSKILEKIMVIMVLCDIFINIKFTHF